MSKTSRAPTRLALVLAGAMAVLAASIAPAALAQGVTATPKVAKPAPDVEVKALKRQLELLEERVAELEKEKAEEAQADDSAEEEARARKLEQRLASLEKALSKSSTDGATSGSAERADDEALTVRAPFVVLDDAGRTIFRVDVPPDRNGLPRAVVGNLLGAHVEMGPGAGNSAIVMYDESNTPSIQLVAGTKDTYLRLADTEHTAVLGSGSSGRGLFLRRKSATLAAALALGSSGGGNLRVFNAAGAPVAGLVTDSNGGRVIVAHAATGKTVASLTSEAAGGAVRVFPSAGGHARADLGVDGAGGALNLWDSAGSEIRARLSSNGAGGAGLLEIGNGLGDLVVTAGATQNNAVGFVSTGPFDAGVAGTMGGGMSAASSLLGRKSDGKKK